MIRVVAGCCSRSFERFFFVAKRAEPRDYAGCWEFPGGKVDAGESDEEALKREWVEEMGVRILVGRKLYEHVFAPIPPERPSEIAIATYEIVILGEPMAIEHSEIRWVDRRTLATLRCAPSLARALMEGHHAAD